MEQEPLLLTIAQIAVTLAGFSGLVVAIRGASPESWHARDIWSLTWMFGSSFGALFLALLPLVLRSFGLNVETIWRIADLVMSIFVLFFSAIMIIWGHRLTNAGFPPRVRFFPRVARVLLVATGICVGAAATGLFAELRAALFLVALVACLVIAALSLVVFLVVLARVMTGRS